MTCPDIYRGWSITFEYGNFYAFGPNYEASWEGEESGWVGNSETACARTRDGVIAEIDTWFEENQQAPA